MALIPGTRSLWGVGAAFGASEVSTGGVVLRTAGR